MNERYLHEFVETLRKVADLQEVFNFGMITIQANDSDGIKVLVYGGIEGLKRLDEYSSSGIFCEPSPMETDPLNWEAWLFVGGVRFNCWTDKKELDEAGCDTEAYKLQF